MMSGKPKEHDYSASRDAGPARSVSHHQRSLPKRSNLDLQSAAKGDIETMLPCVSIFAHAFANARQSMFHCKLSFHNCNTWAAIVAYGEDCPQDEREIWESIAR